MMVVDSRLRIWDLSSDAPHRPTVSKSSPPHSTTPSKSLALSGLAVENYDYTLLQKPSEILTPEINRLMSPRTSPRMPDNFERHSTTAYRRAGVVSPESTNLSEFSQWDQYIQSSHSLPSVGRTSSISSRASLKRTDFTSKKELEEQARTKGFIFHKGFFKRRSNDRRLGHKCKNTRNRAEIDALLSYTDLRSFAPTDVISSKKVVIYRPKKITRRDPGVQIASEVPVQKYLRRKPSTRPPAIRRIPQIGRSNTCPSSVRSMRRRSYTPESGAVRDLWKEYLALVIAQRIQLRLSLMSTDIQTLGASTGEVNDIPIENLMHKNSTKSSLRSADTRLSSLRKCS